MYLVFDVGTTSMKTGVFDQNFNTVYSHASEYQLLYPGKNLVELPAAFYWSALKEGITDALRFGVLPEEIDAVTITTQGETLVPVDQNGEALCNAIVWLDARAEKEAAELNEKIDANEFFHTTGLTDLGAAAPIAKLMWIRKNRPEVYEKTACFLLLEDYLIYRLSGELVTEYSLLSSTGYFDITQNCYWQGILEAAGIDPALLPTPRKCAEVVGVVTSCAAQESGLKKGTPVTTGAMDQIAGAVGAGNISPGIITETTGTCLVLAATAQTPDFDAVQGAFSVYKHFNDQYLYLPYNSTAAIILKWFKETFMADFAEKCAATGSSVYQEMDRMAMNAPPGANGLIMVPHFSGKLVPDFNADAKGVFYGIGLDTTRSDFIRAVLEGIAYMLRENMECLKKAGIAVEEIRSLGGGSRSDFWMQIKADICGSRFVRTQQSEAGSLGAAMLGALAVRHYSSAGEIIEICTSASEAFWPDPQKKQTYDDTYRKYLLLYQALTEVYHAPF